ncbi:MAG: hypothetical protein KJ057_09405 [Phycisphaerae bacterium]|nr:MAG: hypothetical protein EDS66_12430 [Planctomycetota bacterium]KAB2949941.1 MAG: hypothetical protein F9K17_01185 [Phycisphaerae bacterium]MBE7458570.1 hypothetical protein [Planctomycetia bacterium]MCK6465027.1 hypothetical protein [Phycisphaerae bacterium]MCL4718675.1 hypothetical protein [Phycisphaerae bacterium]
MLGGASGRVHVAAVEGIDVLGLRSKITRIGLDIGAEGTRVAQLERVRADFRLGAFTEGRHAAPASVPSGEGKKPVAATQPTVTDLALPEHLRECLERSAARGRRVAIGLASPDIELHPLELPPFSADTASEYAQIAHVEIQRLAGKEHGELETAYWALPKGVGRSPTAVGVAASRVTVDRLLSVCREAHLDCETVDAAACAVVRTAGLVLGARPGAIWGVLDLGARQTRLVLCVDQTPVLARAVGDGGRGWTERIAEELRISAEAAEIHKCDVGIEPGRRGVRRSGATGTSEPGAALRESVLPPAGSEGGRRELAEVIFGVLQPPLARLVTEIERSFSYVLSCYPSSKARDVILVGGGAGMRGLPEFLSSQLGIAVQRLGDAAGGAASRLMTPMQRSGASLSSVKTSVASLERLATAIGLALRGDET